MIDGEVTDLGTYWLSPGTSVLEGEVNLPAETVASARFVQLHGVGRRPGDCCETPAHGEDVEIVDLSTSAAVFETCGPCGYGEPYSLCSLEGTAAFRFEDLSSGFVRAVVVAEQDRVLGAKEFAIEPATHHQVSIDIEFKNVEVTLVDSDGLPFEGLWTEDGALYSAPISMHLWIDDVLAAESKVTPFSQGLVLGSGSFGPELGGLVLYHEAPHEDAEDPLRALWPRAVVPRPAIATALRPVTRVRPGTYLIRDVPADCDAVQIACGPFLTDAIELEQAVGLPDSATISRSLKPIR